MKNASLLVTLIVVLLGVSACGGATPPPSSPPAAAASVRIAFIPPAYTSPFHVAVKEGVQRSGAGLGWEMSLDAPDNEGDFARQSALFEQAVNDRVAAIGVTPINPNAIAAGVKKANAAGIPVFVPNLITPLESGKVVQYIGYDQWGGADLLAKYSCAALKNEGQVFILTGRAGFHTNRRTGGFKAGLQKYCPRVQIVGEQTGEWEREKSAAVASAALQQQPEIDLFYGNSDEMSIGACQAARQLKRTVNQDIFCVGIDGNAVTLDLIEKGEVSATLGVYPDKIGETMVGQMAAYLKGAPVPQILMTPSVVVDAANLADYRSGKTWTAPVEGAPELDNRKPTTAKAP